MSFTTPVKCISSKSSNLSSETKAMTESPSPTSTPRRIPRSRIVPTNSIGSTWTVEMTNLKFSGSFFEAVQCLRRIRDLLAEIDRPDRIKFCKPDFEAAIKLLKKQKNIWSDELFREIVEITTDYFNQNKFQRLPTEVFQELLMWLPTTEYTSVTTVSWEWYDVGCSNEIWNWYYHQKFVLTNPRGIAPPSQDSMMFAFKYRLRDPIVGDKVEVAWRGKFRLETQDVYQGLAWWVAEVVDKHQSPEGSAQYKIHYPGWESRWDEWVPRQRLRWAVARNVLVGIGPGDTVEMWCCGANVPGAWLECKVKKVRNGRYSIGRVLSSGYLCVERERLRLVKRAGARDNDNDDEEESRSGSLFGLFTSFSQRVFQLSNGGEAQGPQGSGCTVM